MELSYDVAEQIVTESCVHFGVKCACPSTRHFFPDYTIDGSSGVELNSQLGAVGKIDPTDHAMEVGTSTTGGN